MEQQKNTFQYRSLYWPIVLIGIGLLWLLANLELIPDEGWMTLLRFWPIFLIAIGVDIMIGRHSRLVGGAIGVSVVALAVVLVLLGPDMGLAPDISSKTNAVSEPIGAAESAQIDLDLSVGVANIYALEDSSNLLDGEITHSGTLDFSVTGEQEKRIRLSERDQHLHFNWWFDDFDYRWDIGLTPEIPLKVTIDGGVGESNLDFSQLDVTDLDVDCGVGDMTITLPATDSNYEVDLDVGVGRVEVKLEEDIDATITINGGVGDTIIVVPEGLGVRLVGEIGVGDINVPGGYSHTGADDDNFMGDSGVWESPEYSEAAHTVTIKFDGGVGNFTIR
jgi:hypothetical protein